MARRPTWSARRAAVAGADTGEAEAGSACEAGGGGAEAGSWGGAAALEAATAPSGASVTARSAVTCVSVPAARRTGAAVGAPPCWAPPASWSVISNRTERACARPASSRVIRAASQAVASLDAVSPATVASTSTGRAGPTADGAVAIVVGAVSAAGGTGTITGIGVAGSNIVAGGIPAGSAGDIAVAPTPVQMPGQAVARSSRLQRPAR